MTKFARSIFGRLSLAALIAATGHAVSASAASFLNRPVSTSPLVLAQSKSAPAATLTVTGAVTVAPGERAKLPISVGAEAKSSNLFIMLHRVPAWLTVVGGDPVGAGVWLVPATRIEQTEIQIAASATGEQAVQVSLLAADGSVARETPLRVVVGPARPTTAAASPAATAPPPQAPLAKTWVGIVSEQTKATETAQATATPTPAARVAQAVTPARPAAPAGPRDEAALVEYARYLVRECTTCHSLYGQDVGIPLMIGLSTERFLDTMRLYKAGRRDHPPMQSVAQALTDEETLALALYLGRIKPPSEPSAVRASSSTATPSSSGTPPAAPKRSATDSADRTARWIKRGEDLIASGEIVQARLMLERAADNGSAQAAYLLGTSYDPNALPWRPGIGIDAEPLKAREWYLTAQRLGDTPEVSRRLADLPAPR